MLTIDLGTIELFDSTKKQFIYEDGGIVRFEYSLKAVYNWEAKWKKPFLKGERTHEELVDFYMTMALDPIDEKFLTEDVMTLLAKYITDSNTATTFTSGPDGQNGNNSPSRKKIHTAEEIYALMVMANIPIEFENRNLNRLLVILQIINTYNSPPKKMNRDDILRQNAQLNAERKKQMNTRG